MTYIIIAFGGALGSVARYMMQSFIGSLTGPNFPYGTLIVNISGSIIMGLFIGWLARTNHENAQQLRFFIAIGILGGYTTFSSFSLEAITLYQEGRWLAMGMYIAGSVVLSLAGLLIGLKLMRLAA
jgi:CrcB protein